MNDFKMFFIGLIAGVLITFVAIKCYIEPHDTYMSFLDSRVQHAYSIITNKSLDKNIVYTNDENNKFVGIIGRNKKEFKIQVFIDSDTNWIERNNDFIYVTVNSALKGEFNDEWKDIKTGLRSRDGRVRYHRDGTIMSIRDMTNKIYKRKK